MEINVEIKVKIPHPPTFLRVDNSQGSIDIGSLNDDSYAQFEEQYMKALRKHWLSRRKKVNKTR